MKTIAILLVSCLLFSSCLKKENLNEKRTEEEKQEVLSQETLGQEVQKIETSSYVFDIDSFKYLDEFPRTINGIKEMYPNESFEEKVSKRLGKSIHIGEYAYSLNSPNIQFGFWGDTTEEAILFTVEIFNSDYQCENMQVIGMSAEELEFVSNRKLNLDKNIIIYTESHDGLIIMTKNGIVINYLIVGMY